MQALSRLAVTGGGSGMAGEEEHKAVIRELTRGRQLTARLRAEALSALRGQGQAEATAALILQEVSRAFNVCLSIMSSPARAPPPPVSEIMPAAAGRLRPTTTELAGGQRRNREDSIPREQTVTSSPHYDGYQWRKYGQKRITKTHYPRCYYRCSFHRERNCRATKQVQQCSGGDPPQYLVMYFNDHTCDMASSSSSSAAVLDMSAAGQLVPRRGVQEEEHQVLVSSLARVLRGQQFNQSPPDVDVGVEQGTCDAPAAAAPAAAAGGMPRLDDVDVAVGQLDVMDYDDVTAELCFGDSYGRALPFC